MRVAIGVTVSLKLRLQLNYSGSDSSIHYFATAVTSGRISHQNHRLSMVPFAGLCSHRTRSHATIVTWPLGRNGMLHTDHRSVSFPFEMTGSVVSPVKRILWMISFGFPVFYGKSFSMGEAFFFRAWTSRRLHFPTPGSHRAQWFIEWLHSCLLLVLLLFRMVSNNHGR